MKRIALLGCGAIGTRIALAIDSGRIPGTLTHVFDESEDAARTLVSKLGTKPEIVQNSHLLSLHNVNIVVEAASQDAVRDVGLSILQNKRDLMVMSVGALLDESVHDVLRDACADFKRTIYLPSGAIGGLDAIRSVRDELESVSVTTTKHPRSLKGARFFESSGIDPDTISARTVLFEGHAGDAVALFPANVNVAALLSLSGIGSQKTRVTVVADPGTDRNTHHIRASGRFGEMSFVIENLPDPDNPRTSRLATLSAIETLGRYCRSDGIQIGT